MNSVMIIVPACNEGLSLEHFLPKLQGQLYKIAPTLELAPRIVVVDDGSTDDTSRVVKAKGCDLIRNATNMGVGHSIRRGYAYALEKGCDYVVTMDSDGQHDAEILQRMFRRLNDNCEVVTASRYHPESPRFSPPIDRDLLNIAVRSMIQSVTGWRHITDPLVGFWAMKRWVVEFLSNNLKQDRYGIWLESIIKLWHLCEPRPLMDEVPHPAIYANTAGGFLNRVYSPANMEDRVDRFGVHALNIIHALQDIEAAGKGEDVEANVKDWRQELQQLMKH